MGSLLGEAPVLPLTWAEFWNASALDPRLLGGSAGERQPPHPASRLRWAAGSARPGALALSTGSALATNADNENRAADLADLRAIAGGDRIAFARLIDRESPRLLRLARGILGSLEEAEDVVQECCISLWENAGRWKPEARIGTWLHTITYNRCIDRLRRRRHFVDERALEAVPDSGPAPDGHLVEGETARSVRAAFERLPQRQRSAVLLFHFQDLSQSEAAGIMQVSEAAFESLLARARRALRAMLADAGGADD